MKKNMIFPVFMLLAGVALSQGSSESLSKKWNTMLDKAESYQLYKVIKKTDLEGVWKAIQDSSNQVKKELAQEKIKVKRQGSQIDQLQKQDYEVKAKLERISKEKNSMGFLGMDVNKYTYTAILWFIIILVLLSCGILFFLYFNSNNTTIQKISDYEQLSKTLEEYKYSKIEMERKLKREIQTYMNKVEELKNK
jgi:thiamine biosynthesis lipoprotein ApbE